MSISYKILGKPGRDNALMVWINSGTKLYRILFDCGENLLHEIPSSDVRAIDYIFFSHFHLDHAAGFDYFFRRNYDRETKPVYIFGPAETSSIIQNRMRGYKWNLVSGIPGEWFVTDILADETVTYRFLAREGFSKKHFVEKKKYTSTVFSNEHFSVSATLLNHLIESAAYRINGTPSLNIDKNKLVIYNYESGPWLEMVKDLFLSSRKVLSINGEIISLGELRKRLLIKHEGENISYLTDFIFDSPSKKKAIKLIKNCDTVICESQYLTADVELAKKNYHLTVSQAAEIASKGNAGKLIIFHNSERYNIKDDYLNFLKEARAQFQNTFFPEEWV